MSSGSFGTPPTVPTEYQQYNSYIIDPEWQKKFSIIWASLLGFVVLCSAPHLVWAIKRRRAFVGLSGVAEGKWWEGRGQGQGLEREGRKGEKGKTIGVAKGKGVKAVVEMVGSVLMWAPPGLGLNIGQISVILIYLLIVLLCIIMDSELVDNSNRAGFIALAQLPPVFLFATKNSVVSLLLGPGNGYEKLNYVHRWTSRTLFLGACVHGALWIRNHLQYNIQILGAQKETSGVAALGVLCGIVLTSLKPVRKWWYQGFYVAHILAFPAFFITVCYHTIYATPWIFPPLAIYGFDMAMRMMRVRVKDASLEASGEMTIIRIRDCTSNWLPGQHLRVRVFIGGRSVFESHPLTVMNAPSSRSCLTGLGGKEESDTIMLGARVAGDWTKALNDYARGEGERLSVNGISATSSKIHPEHVHALPQVPVLTMIDGPYGGPSVDFAEYANVLIVVGGSGATFGVGVLDSILGRVVRGSEGVKTRRVRFVWCMRSFGQIHWLTGFLQRLVRVADSVEGFEMQITIYVTCLCDPEGLPEIPNCEIILDRGRPEVGVLVGEFVRPSSTIVDNAKEADGEGSVSNEDVVGDIEVVRKTSDEEVISPSALEKGLGRELPWVGLEGGVGICACGPESLVREAGNAVVGLKMARGARKGGLDAIGDVGFYSEVYCM